MRTSFSNGFQRFGDVSPNGACPVVQGLGRYAHAPEHTPCKHVSRPQPRSSLLVILSAGQGPRWPTRPTRVCWRRCWKQTPCVPNAPLRKWSGCPHRLVSPCAPIAPSRIENWEQISLDFVPYIWTCGHPVSWSASWSRWATAK